MGTIQTVCGTITPDALGFCQTHEHVWCDSRLFDRADIRSGIKASDKSEMIFNDADRMLEELIAYREMGGKTLVDVTTHHWRPDTLTLQKLSEKSNVNIIITGGFYTEPSIPRWVDEKGINELTEILIAELVEGDAEHGVKVGLYKSGIWRGRIEGPELKALRAVARAVLETGAAMTTHTTGSRRYEVPNGNVGPIHLKIFQEEGVPAHRLIVGHVDERPDINVLSTLAEAGCFIQFDVIGKTHWLLDETRALLIKELKARGYLDRILLGTDRCRKAELYKERGGLGYTYLFDHFFSILKKHGGITDSEIRVIMEENPAQALMLSP